MDDLTFLAIFGLDTRVSTNKMGELVRIYKVESMLLCQYYKYRVNNGIESTIHMSYRITRE